MCVVGKGDCGKNASETSVRNERSITHMSYKLTCGPRGRESIMAQTFRSDQEQDLSKVAWRHPEAQSLRNYPPALFS